MWLNSSLWYIWECLFTEYLLLISHAMWWISDAMWRTSESKHTTRGFILLPFQNVCEYLFVSIQWLWHALSTEDCSKYLQGHFWRECVHWDMTEFWVFTSILVLSAFPPLNNHIYPFCLCIQVSSILHTIHWKKKILSLSSQKALPDLALLVFSLH